MIKKLVLIALLGGAVFAVVKSNQLLNQEPTAFEVGEQRLTAHDYQTAIQWFRYALEQSPRDGRVHAELGTCYYQIGEFELAAAHYIRAESAVEQMHALPRRRHTERMELLSQRGFEITIASGE